MGKRTRKTRWRTLPIGDEQSDSEESNSTLDTRIPPSYHQKYYGRFTYSSQSTPTRRYQSDGTKSTRSSSTASENKITFNEDEYTRITTPRQDVLFKKGYLNKPKAYSTQTSTGNSTTSTGNSTGNGTPDYQSTDLEYESHFVFPNGFLDQNGIYYVNSYDPYPLMVYNAPPYYNSETCTRKKYSTESLAETASTTNEETPQDTVNHSGGAAPRDELQHTPPPQPNVTPHHPSHMPPPTEYGHQVYNVVYPGFYYNGLCPPQDLVNGQGHHSEPKRIKRRRRRKLSESKADGQQQNGTTSEYTEDEISSAEEEEELSQKTSRENPPFENNSSTSSASPSDDQTNENTETEAQIPLPNSPCDDQNETKNDSFDPVEKIGDDVVRSDTSEMQDITHEIQSDSKDNCVITNNTAENSLSLSDTNTNEEKGKYDLKPDAEEFIPRALRPENLQYFKMPPNFVPVPLLSPMGAQNYNHGYLPPSMPLNFIQQNHPMYPGYVPGYLPLNLTSEHMHHPMNGAPQEDMHQVNPEIEAEVPLEARNRSDIDIRTVVSKLEEVANEPPTKPDSSFEKRNRTQHATSPNKMQGPYRHYDERKKFYSKNIKQNGHYQNRTHTKYQTNGYNDVHQYNGVHHKQECIQDVQENTKVNQSAVGNDISEIPKDIEVAQERMVEKVSESKPVTEERHAEIIVQNSQESVNHTKVAAEQCAVKNNVNKEVLSKFAASDLKQHVEVTKENSLTNGKIHPSPKFQPRPPRDDHNNTPKIVYNNSTDFKKTWPKRDDRNVQRRDQTMQYPEERTNQGYKQNESPRHKFNRKFIPNSPVKRPTNQTNGQSYSSHENVKKYSETVKRPPQSFTPKPAVRENVIKNIQEIKPDTPELNNTHINKTQWISVSNKKKRRNRNVEESEESFEVPEEPQPNKLVEFEQNAFLQNIVVNGHSKIEELQVNEPKSANVDGKEISDVLRRSPVKILEVRDLEKELLNSVGIETKEEETIIIENNVVEQETKTPKTNSKKKSKKCGPKQTTKRVIITDIDLSENLPEAKIEEIIEETQVIPEDVKTEVVEELKEVPLQEPQIVETKVEVIQVVEPEVVSSETSEKKTKKKKKKQTKNTEISPNNALLNSSCEDTYDLLLENTFSNNNSDDKTNMEISQELDLIIQRGMYSSLEEKIKSLNIIPIKEEFFQSVVRSSREPSLEKNPEFSKLLASSMPKFKYCMASVEDDIPNVPLSDLARPSTSKNDMFVENSEVNALLEDMYGKNATPAAEIGEIVTKACTPMDAVVRVTKEQSVEKVITRESSVVKDEVDAEKLYPITRAVKNWMTKTRENTPEVEILKSPSVIFKEFCEKSPDNENGAASTNGNRNSSISESDEEITVYSASRNNSDAVDLLECWENDISTDSGRKSSIEDACDIDSKNKFVPEEGEDVLEVYESKYGQNEDFIELQKEIEEKQKQENEARTRNFPKHGALPYRAICCNVM